MSTKKSQKVNPSNKTNGSQASTPNGGGAGNIDEASTQANAAGAIQNPLQMNPQQMANGMPMMNNMNNMNFNPNFKANPTSAAPGVMLNNGAGLHPQQLAAFQAQAHFANLQQDPNRNNPQYQQYLQQLQQQNQMFMQMQQNNQQQQQQQQQQQLHQQHPQAPGQGFQGQIPQQVPPQFQQAGQNVNPQHPAQGFPHPQSQQPTPLQPHQQQPQGQQAGRPGQIPTPQQTHPTQTQPNHQQPQSATAATHTIPTPQQQHSQIPQNPQQQNQGPTSDQPKLSRMPSVSQPNQIPRQQHINAGSITMNRPPQGIKPGTGGAGGAGANTNISQGTAQGAAQAAQAAQSGMNNMQNSNPSSAMNPSMMNVINFRRQMSNLATLKFLDFCELIGVRTDSTKNILYWRKIISDYFSEIGVLRYSVKSGVDSRQFEFSVPIIPRFFFSIIQSGVTRMEIQPGLLRTQVLANGATYLESSRCCFTHYYADGSYVNIHGNIRGILNQNLKLDWLDFQTHVFIPGVEWPSLEKVLSDEQKVKDIFQNQDDNKADNPETKRLQILTKFRSNYKVFHSMSNFGLQESVMRVMQVSDVMAHLKSLMLFSVTSEDPTGPLNSLDAFVSQSMANASEMDTTTLDQTAKEQDKGSPLNMAQSPAANSGKAPSLDLSNSTLTKRRRKSTVDNGLSPKSTADSPKATTSGNTNKSNKKAKR